MSTRGAFSRTVQCESKIDHGVPDPCRQAPPKCADRPGPAERGRPHRPLRASTLEGHTAARKGKEGGRPPVITDDTVTLSCGAARAAVRRTDPARLIIPAGKRKGRNPSVGSICRAPAEHAKREVCPEAVEQAHIDFAVLQVGQVPGARLAVPGRVPL